MSEDDGLRRYSEGPAAFVHGDGYAIMNEVLEEKLIEVEKLFETETVVLVAETDVEDCRGAFDGAREERPDCSALDAERREAEMPEDENPVEEEVREECSGGDEEPGLDIAGAPHEHDERVGETEEEVCPALDAQVVRAKCDDARVTCEDPHDFCGEEERRKPENAGAENPYAERDRDRLGNRGFVPFAEILRGEDSAPA